MQKIVKALSHPLLISTFTIFLSGVVLRDINARRDEDTAKAEKAIETIEHAAEKFNDASVRFFNYMGDMNDATANRFHEAIDGLFENRVVMDIKSIAYLEGATFSEIYQSLMYEYESLYVASRLDSKACQQLVENFISERIAALGPRIDNSLKTGPRDGTGRERLLREWGDALSGATRTFLRASLVAASDRTRITGEHFADAYDELHDARSARKRITALATGPDRCG